MSYEFTHRGYRLIFDNDELSAAVSLEGGGDVLYIAREHDEVEWHGDEANQSTVTALVDAIRWIGQDARTRINLPIPTAAAPPSLPDLPTPPTEGQI